jgi:hypothetical protein
MESPSDRRRPVKAADLFHIGIVAEDPEAAAATLSAVLGYEWTPLMGGPNEAALPAGAR